MVLVQTQIEPYHFVEPKIRKTLKLLRDSSVSVVTDIVGCLSFTFL